MLSSLACSVFVTQAERSPACRQAAQPTAWTPSFEVLNVRISSLEDKFDWGKAMMTAILEFMSTDLANCHPILGSDFR